MLKRLGTMALALAGMIGVTQVGASEPLGRCSGSAAASIGWEGSRYLSPEPQAPLAAQCSFRTSSTPTTHLSLRLGATGPHPGAQIIDIANGVRFACGSAFLGSHIGYAYGSPYLVTCAWGYSIIDLSPHPFFLDMDVSISGSGAEMGSVYCSSTGELAVLVDMSCQD